MIREFVALKGSDPEVPDVPNSHAASTFSCFMKRKKSKISTETLMLTNK